MLTANAYNSNQRPNDSCSIYTKQYPYQVTNVLIKEELDLDEKNQDNQTALDIVSSRSPTSQEDREIQELLRKANALETSELPNVVSMEDLLISHQYALFRTIARNHAYVEKGITDDMRSIFLVVTVLIVTATFQAVLSPPGGVWQSTHDNNNSSNSDISNNDDRKFSKDELFTPFVVVNSLAFSASLALTFMFLPYRRYYNFLLMVSLRCLMAAYVISVFLISPPTNWTPGAFASTVLVELVFIGAVVSMIYPLHQLIVLMLPPSLRRPARRILSKTTTWYQMEKQVRRGKYVT